MYYRVQRLPEPERSQFTEFYKQYIGNENLREDLGECYIQALEYCRSLNIMDKLSLELQANLSKFRYFYSASDPRAIAIDAYLECVNHRPEYSSHQYLKTFFENELRLILECLYKKREHCEHLKIELLSCRSKKPYELSELLSHIREQMEIILDFLVKQLQQTRYSGKFRENIDGEFEKVLIDLIDKFSEVCLDALKLGKSSKITDETRRIFGIIETLVQSCLIVRHPYEKSSKDIFYKYVLKTKAFLPFQVDFFAPRILSEVNQTNLSVNGIVVNENTAEEYLHDPRKYKPKDCYAAMSFSKQEFEVDNERNILTAKYSKFSVSHVIRGGKKNNDNVTDEKVVLVFHTYVKFDNRVIDVLGFSLPVVFIVHVNQESGGHGTMAWHNALTKYGYLGHRAPEVADYSEVAKIFNDRFFYTTGRGLSLDDLKYISNESFNVGNVVTMRVLLKEVLPNIVLTKHQKEDKDKSNKPPSYWDWFYECNKLTASRLKDAWKRGLIEGFIPRALALEMLSDQPDGTFMIRFSQSMVGVITIVNNYGDAPYCSSNDFLDKTLDQLILGFDDLKILYKNRLKTDYFFASPQQTRATVNPGYVRVRNLTHFIILKRDYSASSPGSISNERSSTSGMSPNPIMMGTSASSNGLYSPNHVSPYMGTFSQTSQATALNQSVTMSQPGTMSQAMTMSPAMTMSQEMTMSQVMTMSQAQQQQQQQRQQSQQPQNPLQIYNEYSLPSQQQQQPPPQQQQQHHHQQRHIQQLSPQISNQHFHDLNDIEMGPFDPLSILSDTIQNAAPMPQIRECFVGQPNYSGYQ